MRVLAFSDHLSEESSGGAERVALQVYSRLAFGDEIELTVVSVLRPGHLPARIAAANVRAVAGRDLSRYVGAELLLGAGLARCAADLAKRVRPDVIHANGLHFHGTAVAARLARRTGVPLVTTAHLGDLSALGLLRRLGGTVWDRTVGSYAVRASHSMVAVSKSVAAHLPSLGADPAAITVAPNGVDHVVFHSAGRCSLRLHGPLRAVFVGRLINNKGPQVALDAVAAARAAGRDVQLTILGDGPLRGRLVEQARALGIEGHVRFTGHVSGIADALREGDVLLRPSFTEGLPLAVLEAMACGLPVVCSTVPGNTEVVRDRVNGLHTRPGDALGVGRALVGLFDDRGLLRRLGAEAQTVAAEYTWERSAEVHLAALRAAAGLPSAADVTAHSRPAKSPNGSSCTPRPTRPPIGETRS